MDGAPRMNTVEGWLKESDGSWWNMYLTLDLCWDCRRTEWFWWIGRCWRRYSSMKRVPLRGGALWNPVFFGVSREVMGTDADSERAIFEKAVQKEGEGTFQPNWVQRFRDFWERHSPCTERPNKICFCEKSVQIWESRSVIATRVDLRFLEQYCYGCRKFINSRYQDNLLLIIFSSTLSWPGRRVRRRVVSWVF